MSKGSQPAGVTTTTRSNPAAEAQLPYLQQGWEQAQNLYQNNPQQYYPGQTLANARPYDPRLGGGYTDLWHTGGWLDSQLRPQANDAFSGAVGGNLAPQQMMTQLGGMATGAASDFATMAMGGNLGLSQLGRTASGEYLGGPQYEAMFQMAADPVMRQYQTATAPQTDAQFANAGRYGSGAMMGAQSRNNQDLMQGLGNISTSLYDRERRAQDAAANQYAQLSNQGLELGAGQYFKGLGLAGDMANRNLSGQLDAMRYPQLAQSQFLGQQQQIEAGKGLSGLEQTYRGWDQAAIDDAVKRFQGEQSAPWNTLQQYTGLLGNPIGGSGTESTPYYQNQAANMMGMGLGGLSMLGMIPKAIAGVGSLFE